MSWVSKKFFFYFFFFLTFVNRTKVFIHLSRISHSYISTILSMIYIKKKKKEVTSLFASTNVYLYILLHFCVLSFFTSQRTYHRQYCLAFPRDPQRSNHRVHWQFFQAAYCIWNVYSLENLAIPNGHGHRLFDNT